jgi:methionyl-tRNA formyltransferase
MLTRTLPRLFDGTVERRPQVGQPTFYAKRTPADGQIDWERMGVCEIHNLVRAVTRPYPGAFTVTTGGECVTVWAAVPWDTQLPFYAAARLGQVVEVFAPEFVVNCLDGLLLVTEYGGPLPAVGWILGT